MRTKFTEEAWIIIRLARLLAEKCKKNDEMWPHDLDKTIVYIASNYSEKAIKKSEDLMTQEDEENARLRDEYEATRLWEISRSEESPEPEEVVQEIPEEVPEETSEEVFEEVFEEVLEEEVEISEPIQS